MHEDLLALAAQGRDRVRGIRDHPVEVRVVAGLIDEPDPDDAFTMRDLRSMYESVLGERLVAVVQNRRSFQIRIRIGTTPTIT